MYFGGEMSAISRAKSFLLLLTIIIFMHCIVGCENSNVPSKQAEKVFNSGFAYFQNGNYYKAIELFDQAIALFPKYSDAYNFRGSSYAKIELFANAIRDYDKAIEFGSKNLDETYLTRGAAHFELKEYDKAISDLSQAIKLSPNYVDAYITRVFVFADMGKYEAAIADLNKVSTIRNSVDDIFIRDAIRKKHLRSLATPDEPWNEATISSSKISLSEKIILSLIGKDNADGIADALKYYEANTVDLNSDGVNEIVVTFGGMNWCGASGNCHTTIIELNGTSYKPILGDSAFRIAILEDITKNYHDIVTYLKSGSSETICTIYKYNGKEYVDSKRYIKLYGDGDSLGYVTGEQYDNVMKLYTE